MTVHGSPNVASRLRFARPLTLAVLTVEPAVPTGHVKSAQKCGGHLYPPHDSELVSITPAVSETDRRWH